MTRNELLDMFTPIYDEFAMLKFAEHLQQHPKIFDVIEDPTKDWKFNQISGLGAWDAVDEDTDDGIDHFVIGYEGTLSQAKYRKFFYVTFEVNDQIEYASLKSKIIRAEALGQGGRSRVERTTFGKLYSGFSTAIANGQYLFSDSHPKNPEETGTTYDNLLSGGFSHDNLELAERQIADNMFDMDGEPIMLAETPYLVHAPGLRGQVKRVLDERAKDNIPGTEQFGINIFAGNYIPLESPFLSAKMGGSDTAWYIIYPGMKNLKMIWAQKPKFASWIDNHKHRYYFDGWEHFVCGPVDWRGISGSTGL